MLSLKIHSLSTQPEFALCGLVGQSHVSPYTLELPPTKTDELDCRSTHFHLNHVVVSSLSLLQAA
jgi:hypothetical protein